MKVLLDVQIILVNLFFVMFSVVELSGTGKLYKRCIGKYARGNIITEETVETITACVSLCLSLENCNAANYKKNERLCVLLSTGYKFHGNDCTCLITDSNTDFIFGDYPCYFQAPFVAGVCQCAQGYSGHFCENPPRDCSSFDGSNRERTIHPYGADKICHTVAVPCTGTRLHLFRAPSGSFPSLFNADWDVFKLGFGQDRDPEFWLGNKYIHQITASPVYNYRACFYIASTTMGTMIDFYRQMYISDESNSYTFYYGSFKGNAASRIPNGTQFRTRDHNNNGCVSTYNAAFWYPSTCTSPSPLGGTYMFAGGVDTVRYFDFYIERI